MYTIKVPLNVPEQRKDVYIKNMQTATKGTGRIMIFAGDQKVEHLNEDFYDHTGSGKIHEDDNAPEHLFRIAEKSIIGVFATQYGIITQYGMDYKGLPYLVKINSKSSIVKTVQKDPSSRALIDFEDVLTLRNAGLNIVGVGYTIYLGSEFEAEMLTEAQKFISLAHKEGMITVLWIYPRGKGIKDEKDPDLIAGAAGVAACLGSDFVKVNYPKKEGQKSEEVFKQAILAAGRTGVVCAGGGSKPPREFLQETWNQIMVSGARGSATGRNIHQKELNHAVKMCNAISSIIYKEYDVDHAMRVYEGVEELRL